MRIRAHANVVLILLGAIARFTAQIVLGRAWWLNSAAGLRGVAIALAVVAGAVTAGRRAPGAEPPALASLAVRRVYRLARDRRGAV